MKYQGELSIVGACGGYSKTPAKHAPAVGNSVLNSPINILGSGSCLVFTKKYPSMAHAKEAYDTVINEARETFGSNPEHRALVRGRASLAFTRRSPSVLAVKSAQRSASEGGHTPEVRSQEISDAAPKTEPQSPRANHEAIGIVSSLLSRDLA